MMRNDAGDADICVEPQENTDPNARHEDHIQQHRVTEKDGTHLCAGRSHNDVLVKLSGDGKQWVSTPEDRAKPQPTLHDSVPGHVPRKNAGHHSQLHGDDHEPARLQRSARRTVFPQHDALTDDGSLGFLQLQDSRAAIWKRDRKRTGQGKGTLRGLRVRCRGDAMLHRNTLNFAELWGGP